MKKNYFLVAILSFVMVTMNAQFTDDMESYTDGEPIFEAHWTDWGCGGGAGCAIMSSSEQAHGGSLSGYIPDDTTTDAVLDLGNKIFGEWGLAFWMFVPNDKEGYFNLQGTVPIGSGEWAVGNITFNLDTLTPGEGLIDDSALGPVSFAFPQGEWFRVVMNWDISTGISSATWQFNVAGVDVLPVGTAYTGADGTSPSSLGGIDYFSSSANQQAYYDDFVYQPEFITLGNNDISAKGFRSAMSNGTLTLKAQENINSVAIYNMLGQQVYNANVNAMQSTVDMSNLSNGTYIVKVNINGTEGSVKVIR
tara:strand:+ start:9121 stop:10041 length:921 start_codon:yes stop_codon:yes gene_type:complete